MWLGPRPRVGIGEVSHYVYNVLCLCGSDNATCVTKYEDNDYHCACAPGYNGRHCEGTWPGFINLILRACERFDQRKGHPLVCQSRP